MKLGRPIKTTKDLPKNWQEIIDDLSSEGADLVEIAVALGISKDTLYRLSEREEIFFDAMKKGKEKCEAWWKREGRTSLRDKDFSYTGWYMNMRNRFGWADKTENQNNHTGSVEVKNQPDLSKLSKAELKEYQKIAKKLGS